jgi:hypothetical protein
VKGSNRHFSKIAFDALMYASSALNPEQRNTLLAHPQAVQNAVEAMYRTKSSIFGGRKTNTADAHRRNQAALEALTSALDAV